MEALYHPPLLREYGSIDAITATLGDPFTGDVSFDVDGNILDTGLNSIHQCPTVNNVACL